MRPVKEDGQSCNVEVLGLPLSLFGCRASWRLTLLNNWESFYDRRKQNGGIGAKIKDSFELSDAAYINVGICFCYFKCFDSALIYIDHRYQEEESAVPIER